MAQHLRLEPPAGQVRRRRRAQFLHRRGPGSGGGLIGRRRHAPDRLLPVQRSQRHHRHRGHAVGIGDHAGPPGKALAVHFGHDQRHAVGHPEGRGVVHHQRAGRGGHRSVLPRDRRAGGEEGHVHALERRLAQRLHHHRIAPEGQASSRRPRRGQQAKFANRKAAPFKLIDQLGAHRAGGADDGDGEGGDGQRSSGGGLVRKAHFSSPG